MSALKIECEEDFDVSPIEQAFSARIQGNAPLAAELIFTDEEGIRALNAKERHKDAVTDVLSFPNLDGICGKRIDKEDFPYCRKRAEEQAEEYGHSLRRELYYLTVHGLCHLLGYDHETEEDKAKMRAEEEAVLSEMGIGRDAV